MHEDNYGVYGQRKVHAQLVRQGICGQAGRPVARCTTGWQLSTWLRTDLALDALNMGLCLRQRTGHDLRKLVHHSNRGVQYVAVRYTEEVDRVGAVASVGSKGDSYDKAMAEAFNSLFKAEVIRNRGPWKGIDDLEFAMSEYIDWFNNKRLHGEIDLVPPVEYEAAHTTVPTPTSLPEQPAQRQFDVPIEPGT